jgi:hypothetical protein
MPAQPVYAKGTERLYNTDFRTTDAAHAVILFARNAIDRRSQCRSLLSALVVRSPNNSTKGAVMVSGAYRDNG